MNRRSMMTALASVTAAGLLPTGAMAQAQAVAVDPAKLPALLGGDFATITSQLALQRSQNPVVRQFAELEIAEQAAVATAFGARPGATGVRPDQNAIIAQLQAAQGPAFDVMYIDGQIAGHEELLPIHRAYARSGNDPMARGASMVGVPGIETHLIMLAGIRRSLG